MNFTPNKSRILSFRTKKVAEVTYILVNQVSAVEEPVKSSDTDLWPRGNRFIR